MPRPITTREHNFRGPDQFRMDPDGTTFYVARCACGNEIQAANQTLLAEYKRAHFTLVAHAMRKPSGVSA